MHILGENLCQKISPYLGTAQFLCSGFIPDCTILQKPQQLKYRGIK